MTNYIQIIENGEYINLVFSIDGQQINAGLQKTNHDRCVKPFVIQPSRIGLR